MSYERSSAINENQPLHQSTTQNTSARANNTLYDLSMLFAMDDDDYVAQLLTLFLRDTPKDLQAMKDALTAKKITEVGSYAHKVKSSAGIIGAQSLSALLAQIDEISRSGRLTDELADAVDRAWREYIMMEDSLQTLLKELK